jgi:hypothetical protein
LTGRKIGEIGYGGMVLGARWKVVGGGLVGRRFFSWGFLDRRYFCRWLVCGRVPCFVLAGRKIGELGYGGMVLGARGMFIGGGRVGRRLFDGGFLDRRYFCR